MVPFFPLETFYLHIVQSLVVQNSPGRLSTGNPRTIVHPGIFIHCTVYPRTCPQTNQRTYNYQPICGIPIKKHIQYSHLSTIKRHLLPQYFTGLHFYTQQEIPGAHALFTFQLKFINTQCTFSCCNQNRIFLHSQNGTGLS